MRPYEAGDQVQVTIDLQGHVISTATCCDMDLVEVDFGWGRSGFHRIDIRAEYVSLVEAKLVAGTIRREPLGTDVAVWTGAGWESRWAFTTAPDAYDHWPLIYTPESP